MILNGYRSIVLLLKQDSARGTGRRQDHAQVEANEVGVVVVPVWDALLSDWFR